MEKTSEPEEQPEVPPRDVDPGLRDNLTEAGRTPPPKESDDDE